MAVAGLTLGGAGGACAACLQQQQQHTHSRNSSNTSGDMSSKVRAGEGRGGRGGCGACRGRAVRLGVLQASGYGSSASAASAHSRQSSEGDSAPDSARHHNRYGPALRRYERGEREPASHVSIYFTLVRSLVLYYCLLMRVRLPGGPRRGRAGFSRLTQVSGS